MKELIALAVFIACTTSLAAQTIISGKVIDRKGNLPVSFANIGIVGSAVGTTSDEDGTFSIEIPSYHLKDSLTFFALGYFKYTVLIRSLDTDKRVSVFMNRKERILKEAVVTTKRQKTKLHQLGNNDTQGGGWILNSSKGSSAGATVALLIRKELSDDDFNFPAMLKTVKVLITKNTVGQFRMRVRIFAMDSLTGFPGVDLLDESIIIRTTVVKDWVNFDLSDLHLRMTKPFFVGFEWVMEEKERSELQKAFRVFEKENPDMIQRTTTLVEGKQLPEMHYLRFLPGISVGKSEGTFNAEKFKSFSRANSFGNWKRSPYSLTAQVTLR